MEKKNTILGISCYYHDSAAALLRDGEIVAAAQEERFNRQKYSQAFPIRAINYCLQEANISVYDVDMVAFYEKPYLKFARTLIGHLNNWPFSFPNFLDMMPTWLEDRLTLPLNLKRELGYNGPVYFLKHHLSHAAASYYASPFDEAAILTVDGIGEWASATWGRASGNQITIQQELQYPNSLGLLYAIVSTFLGFPVFTGEGKVMALAAYGEPTLREQFSRCLDLRPDGSLRLDPACFNLNRGTRMYNRRFTDLMGPERDPAAEFEQRHYDVAATLQAVTEEALLNMARYVHRQTGLKKICLAGGVFLNVVANSRILAETPFDDIFIQPAAGDAGAALGAALYVHHAMLGGERTAPMKNAYLGPGFNDARLERALRNAGLPCRRLDDDELTRTVAQRVADGGIVAWFQGRLEFGPRALGARSILADPRNPAMKQILNERVKHREWFRPYGVSVLRECMQDWFDLDHSSPYMLLVGNLKHDKRAVVPCAMHVDGTSRIQSVTEDENPLYHKLIEAFSRITAVPMVINTSFNVQEPIVCTPEDAVACYLRADMDMLVLGNFVSHRQQRGGC